LADTPRVGYISQSVNVADGWSTLTFSATVFDTGPYWSNATPTRLTVPSGVGYVRVTASIDLGYTCSVCEIYLEENSAGGVGSSYGATANTGFGGTTFTAIAPVVRVVAGDYFTVKIYQNSGGTVNVPVHFSIAALDSAGSPLKTAAIAQMVSVPD